MATLTLPLTAEACRDRMRDLLDESRVLAAEIERITSAHVAESELANQLPAVMDAVCTQWPVTPNDLLGRRRQKSVVEARFTCWLLLHELPGVSFSMIGRTFAGRDHSTIQHGVDSAIFWAATDRKLAAKITACRATLRPH